MPKIESGTIVCNAFEDGNQLLGMAKFTLPEMEVKTFTVSGLGIMGEFEVPANYCLQPMTGKIEFIDNPDAIYRLWRPGVHKLDLRVLKQSVDSGTRDLEYTKDQYIIHLYPKKKSGGDLAPAESQKSNSEFCINYIKEIRDGKVMNEIDCIRQIWIDDTGVDRMAQFRSFLGA